MRGPRSATARPGDIAGRVFEVRGVRVMLDQDLAGLYGVSTKRLNEAVERNLRRFPEDFMFRLSLSEYRTLKSQFATSSSGWGGRRRSTPRAFTEQGVAMLSSVLRSPRAIAVNVEIMRVFVRIRRLHGEHVDLAQRIDELERRFDRRFKVVFDAIRLLHEPKPPQARPIGFRRR
jgi:ORF6N domain-containing protein